MDYVGIQCRMSDIQSTIDDMHGLLENINNVRDIKRSNKTSDQHGLIYNHANAQHQITAANDSSAIILARMKRRREEAQGGDRRREEAQGGDRQSSHAFLQPSYPQQMPPDDTQALRDHQTDTALREELLEATQTAKDMTVAERYARPRGDAAELRAADARVQAAYDVMACINERIKQHRTTVRDSLLQQLHHAQIQTQEEKETEVRSLRSDPKYERFIENGQQYLTDKQVSFLLNLTTYGIERSVCSYISHGDTDLLRQNMITDGRTPISEETWGNCKEILASHIPRLFNQHGVPYTKEDHILRDGSLRIGLDYRQTEPSCVISVYPKWKPERKGPEINLMLNLGPLY